MMTILKVVIHRKDVSCMFITLSNNVKTNPRMASN